MSVEKITVFLDGDQEQGSRQSFYAGRLGARNRHAQQGSGAVMIWFVVLAMYAPLLRSLVPGVAPDVCKRAEHGRAASLPLVSSS